jgi:two-component system CheB/CheR fusion protein
LPQFPLTAPEDGGRRAARFGRSIVEQEPLQSLAERQLLDRYSPAYVVINAGGEVLHGSARTGKYLELAPGVPKADIFGMARPGLRPDLRAAIHKATSTGQVAMQKNLSIGTNGGRQTIDLVVHPIRVGATPEMLYMVIFQDIGGVKSTSEDATIESEDLESANIRQLETELRATRERLQSTTEELESSNEELKSGNEELSSMNEELQSANEELETSKEELQSINEELQTVNAELNARVEELSRANSDIANLLESTQIATVFLDRNLTVKSFTPTAKDVFRLVESDTGRPLTHVRARFHSDTVQEDAERVLRTLSTIERQVESNYNEAQYIMRMLPYRTVDNVIAGVVITFVDITRISAAEVRIGELTRDLRNRIENLETLLDLVPVGILMFENNRIDQIRVNRYGARLLGESGEGSDGAGLRLVTVALRFFEGERELEPAENPLQRVARSGEPTTGFEGKLLRADGSRVDVMMSATPLSDEAGKLRGGIAVLLDISQRKAAEDHQQVLLYELQHRVKNILATIGALATRMLSGGGSLEDFSSAFLGRLRAMATTHDLLSRTNWTGADLQQLVETVLRGQSPAPGAVAVTGPEVVLTPNTASTLGMVLYELATNAAKYGALSEAKGRIEVSWRLIRSADGDRLALDWREIDGPPPPGSIAEGFGTGFIRRSVEYELQGMAAMEPAPNGLRWVLEFPLEGNVQRP